MDFSSLNKFNKIYPLYVETFEEFSPVDNETMTTKFNKVIQGLNRVGRLSESVVRDWNKVMEWALNEGMTDEVNKQLQKWKDDGTFETLINTMLVEINAKVDGFQGQINTTNTNVTNLVTKTDTTNTNVTNLTTRTTNAETSLTQKEVEKQNEIRSKYPKRITKYPFPVAWTWSDAPINIYTDGVKFSTDFDVSKFKNISATTYYVDPVNGIDTNTGLSGSPVKSINKALTLCASGDTIILFDGVYTRTLALNSANIAKSVNIIAQNKGKAICGTHDALTYTKTAGKTYVYQSTRSNVNKVVDISGIANDVTYPLTKVSSIDECDALAGSWYTDNVTLYVHTLDGTTPDNNKVLGLLLNNSFGIVPAVANMVVYLEGIKILGGQNGNVMIQNTATYPVPSLYAKDCDFLHNALLNSVQIEGAKYAFFQNCKAMFADSDGFNYHAKNGQIVKSIEVNCVGGNNGSNVNTFDINNGSTTHDGCKSIRINCTYFNNKGCNVADVHVGTQSLNLGIVAYDSDSSTTDAYRCNFSAQQSGAELWLENCVSFGSLNDIESVTGGTVHVKNTKYKTLIGTGVIDLQ